MTVSRWLVMELPFFPSPPSLFPSIPLSSPPHYWSLPPSLPPTLLPLSLPPVGPAASNLNAARICRGTPSNTTTAVPAGAVVDPTVPLSGQNLYAWYLAVSGMRM